MSSTVYGCIKTADLAWGLGDIGVGLMAWLNIFAILMLQKPAFVALKDYEAQQKAGVEPTFDPKKLDIQQADFWEKR